MRDLNEFTITAEVLRRIENTPDPRLHEILASAIRHLHDFARETKLTEAEWMEGIKFLTRTGHMCSDVRQEFVLLSDTLGLSMLVVAQNHSRPAEATEQTVFGPFHVEGAPVLATHGSNLARGVEGEPLFVRAEVVSPDGPVADAVVDVWQADAEGFYDVQSPDWSLEEAALRGVFHTDAAGRFSFRSILPKSYPIPSDGTVGEMLDATRLHPMRPAHMHYRIAKPGFDPLITHVFVDGDEYLDSDSVFGVRGSCVGQFVRHEPGVAPSGETVEVPFHTLDYRFVLHPRDQAANS
ncbi:6-chlorohydroxyquinol-1,2-dioxygenase [Sphingobium indicum IP26]|uniref:Hydroxyquinol 1,2-dioxygenase n=1 Tax=Sphingobium indicum F2 TaxID=1450518 RepID=A0A8E0WVD5_9SPHN|nr:MULTISPECIES: intradiol ring-cleavage dioxygenase [Sphingobium]EPR16188.1 6-chlorohydroxyquinol-1,2-dioxygenase [Sphingobium indicum IP26]EQB01855.1 6-chlorohydroxyquinol-1,2-dioxygenase [Sphingobium sp. HDIP04]KER37875.1 hydroxyquinol 1,2-dioxygenase [Sphingobium indicum F2]